MHHARRFTLFFVAFTPPAVIATCALAQSALLNPAPPITPTTPQPPTVAEKREENSAQLKIAMRKLETSGASDTVVAQEVAYYQTRDAVLAQQDGVEQQIKDLEARKAELESQLKSPPPIDKLYKFADLDRMKDELASEESRASLLADKLAISKTRLDKAKAAVDECEVKRRQTQTDYDKNKDAANLGEFAAAAERARQDASLAGETLALRKREVERDELAQAVLKLSTKVRREQVARISPQIAFTQSDYQEQVDSIKKSEEAETAAQSRAQAELHLTEGQLRGAQQMLGSAVGDGQATLVETVAAYRCLSEKLSEEVDARSQRLQMLAQLRMAWSRRYQIATADRANTNHEVWGQLKNYQKETRSIIEDLATDLRTQIQKMREVRSSISSAAKKAENAANSPRELQSAIANQQKALDDKLRIYEKNLVMIESSRRVHEKLLDEIGDTVEVVTPKAIALGVWYQIATAWNSELLVLNQQSVKVGDAIKGLTILIAGWLLSRSTSGMFANRFLKRFRLSKDATSAIRTLVFYGLLAFVALTALNTVGVPLTAFTILGGALAIGVGFGSQTLINNFIGGLIMLAERPVRLGERVTFKDIDGVVEDVGFRCTKLRTQSDHLVTIPNSTLVNESIENIDRRRTIRRAFTLAVTFNITHELLAEGVQAIRDILDERGIRERIHPIVGFEEIAPQVYFSDFATESLSIQVTYCYAPVDNNAFAEHCQRVNFRIMEEFDRLGIEFAFPSKTSYVRKNTKPDRRGDSFAA